MGLSRNALVLLTVHPPPPPTTTTPTTTTTHTHTAPLAKKASSEADSQRVHRNRDPCRVFNYGRPLHHAITMPAASRLLPQPVP